ncbi:hypothetical protein D0Z07_1717 [Hyphodiscus hymeniophilus]|uniref:Heterokaryon incompatibility domain-containing protein n=1 Tax=Hyphodiscus hymeniophilus TaxID=353542 RepID=A0A9P7AZZ9_9HELO|nr:hypothetical protein D0Z07_1717 [Hyphodiscus hymeniophilus]
MRGACWMSVVLHLVGDPLAARITRRAVNLPPASKDCFQTASNWLQACLQHHSDCMKKDGYQQLPARVIDVGRPDGSGIPFLCNTNGGFGQWVALSHCWGQTDPLKTTSATIKKHEESLPMRDLPPLFRNAVIITRRLGYQYLWIDSLCIIQDSKADWQAESAHMGDI